jgi:hypothetical protein
MQERGMLGAFCIRFKSFLKKNELQAHQCKDDLIEATWRSFMDKLADAASMRCPQCKSGGLKDPSGNYITCQCAHHWCYHCGKSLSINDKGHFNWRRDSPADSGTCPVYMHEKYVGSLTDATKAFHAQRVQVAISKFKDSTDPAIYEEMPKTKFPGGLPAELLQPVQLRTD